MIILVIADIGDLKWHGGNGQADILLSCGDVDDFVILKAAKNYKCKKIFAVKGNHDNSKDFPDPIINLHLKVIKYKGITFGGLNGSWQYKPMGNFLYKQNEVNSFLENFPYVDIMISHNSPKNIHERDNEVHQGFLGLNNYIKKKKPKLLIHGHQHYNKKTIINITYMICVYGYKLLNINF